MPEALSTPKVVLVQALALGFASGVSAGVCWLGKQIIPYASIKEIKPSEAALFTASFLIAAVVWNSVNDYFEGLKKSYPNNSMGKIALPYIQVINLGLFFGLPACFMNTSKFIYLTAVNFLVVGVLLKSMKDSKPF